MISDSDKRCISLSRTLLFNYGQGIWTPLNVYLDCCVLLDTAPNLSSLPSYKPLNLSFSFFSKQSCYTGFILYNNYNERYGEEKLFCAQPSVTKLCWLRNFTYMQELFFNFSDEEIEKVVRILWRWKRPLYLIDRIPFQKAPLQQHSVSLTIEDI